VYSQLGLELVVCGLLTSIVSCKSASFEYQTDTNSD